MVFHRRRGKECVERLFRARKRSITVALSKRENCRAGICDAILSFHYNRVQVGSENFELDQLDEISGTANEIEIPREAMGRGDFEIPWPASALSWVGVPSFSPSSPARSTAPSLA